MKSLKRICGSLKYANLRNSNCVVRVYEFECRMFIDSCGSPESFIVFCGATAGQCDAMWALIGCLELIVRG